MLRLLMMGASDQTLQSADRVARLTPEGLINAQLWSSLQHQHADARFCEGQGAVSPVAPDPTTIASKGRWFTLMLLLKAIVVPCIPRPPGATGDVPDQKPRAVALGAFEVVAGGDLNSRPSL